MSNDNYDYDEDEERRALIADGCRVSQDEADVKWAEMQREMEKLIKRGLVKE
jgi:hypothetical protein